MMPILISSGVITPGQFGPSSSRSPALHAVRGAHHVAHRDALGNADDEVEVGVDGFVDRRGRERRRHVDHRDVAPVFAFASRTVAKIGMPSKISPGFFGLTPAT